MQHRPDETIQVSIIIVTYQSVGVLETFWPSLTRELAALERSEVFLIDNASADGTFEQLGSLVEASQDQLQQSGGSVSLRRNTVNLGFGRACNQALGEATGRYVLLLNPDTELEPGGIVNAVRYMDSQPDIGIVGARVRLPDGKLDAPCRRSFKTPGIYFYKYTGLSRLFPRSRRFGRYYLSYLDETETTDVDAVIGAFMMVRREVIDRIGLMDERFFMYCEDEDWCFRAKADGWRVVYYPHVVVWHRKGSSTRQRAASMTVQWHRSIFLFHRKNLANSYHPVFNGLLYFGMGLSLLASLGKLFILRVLALGRSLSMALLSRGRSEEPYSSRTG